MQPNVITLIVIGVLASSSKTVKKTIQELNEKKVDVDLLRSNAGTDKIIRAGIDGSANSVHQMKSIPAQINN